MTLFYKKFWFENQKNYFCLLFSHRFFVSHKKYALNNIYTEVLTIHTILVLLISCTIYSLRIFMVSTVYLVCFFSNFIIIGYTYSPVCAIHYCTCAVRKNRTKEKNFNIEIIWWPPQHSSDFIRVKFRFSILTVF